LRILLLTVVLGLAAGGVAIAQTPAPAAVDAWAEEIEGKQALAWAASENTRSLAVLKGDARYEGLYRETLAILGAKDRIPGVSFTGGQLHNFWRDQDNPKGVWRRTTLASYRTAQPVWETILDLDALGKAEGRNWVAQGRNCLLPDERHCMIPLSDGGKDASIQREFDSVSKAFVKDGFVLPEGIQVAAWEDKDTLLVARNWGEGTMTPSGYPFVIKRWKRGTPLAEAKEVFRGTPQDVRTMALVLRDPDGIHQATLALRATSIMEFELHHLTDKGPVRWPFPSKSLVVGLVAGKLIVQLDTDWAEQGLKQGDLAAFDLADLKADPVNARATLILRPTARQSIEGVSNTRNTLVVSLLEDVTSKATVFTPGREGWARKDLDLPTNASITVTTASLADDRLIASVTNYLTPATHWLVDAASGKMETLKTAPERFDASTHLVEQLFATSKDGTRVPYFVVRPKALRYDGSAPTIITAYGGFQFSMSPGYLPVAGKLWMEHGGVFVIANIRGGGEYGPAWHQAGVKAKRQNVYDDFFAVSKDLIARKITSPRRLGAIGNSNGGLLMGVALTQRPDLYNAIIPQVPLLDMLNYTRFGMGASWISEYGDPAKPEERAVLAAYDPYSNLRPGKAYPKVFLQTSSTDDRVHPVHARKTAARLKAYGYDYLYYESTDGGHGGNVGPEANSMVTAMEYIFFTQQLMD